MFDKTQLTPVLEFAGTTKVWISVPLSQLLRDDRNLIDEIDRFKAEMATTTPEATVVGVHWRGTTNTLAGDEAHTFMASRRAAARKPLHRARLLTVWLRAGLDWCPSIERGHLTAWLRSGFVSRLPRSRVP